MRKFRMVVTFWDGEVVEFEGVSWSADQFVEDVMLGEEWEFGQVEHALVFDEMSLN